jgi:hypothetical protein
VLCACLNVETLVVCVPVRVTYAYTGTRRDTSTVLGGSLHPVGRGDLRPVGNLRPASARRQVRACVYTNIMRVCIRNISERVHLFMHLDSCVTEWVCVGEGAGGGGWMWVPVCDLRV